MNDASASEKPSQPLPLINAQEAVWAFISCEESGKLSLDPQDRGNWTSGIVGIGKLVGSKWGISAAAHPNVDIANMTYDGARDICMSEYWPAIQGPHLCDMGAAALAMLMVDVAFSSGPVSAVEILQRALTVGPDGHWGRLTDAALKHALEAPPSKWGAASGLQDLIAEFVAQRILFESKIDTWSRYALGWVRRMTRLESLVHQFLPQPGSLPALTSQETA